MRRSTVLLILLAAGFTAVSVATAAWQATMAGTLTLKPIATLKCKSGTGKVKGKTETDIQCYDTGVYRGSPVTGGASYSWTWYARAGDPVVEKGVIAVNFGQGAVYLNTRGTFVPIGKVTSDYGKAKTTGTWSFGRGTKAYAHARGTGTYSLALLRNAVKYRVLKLTINGHLTR